MAGEMRQLAETPLGEAISAGHFKEVAKLVKCKGNHTFQDRKGNTYLHFVCTMHRPYIFNLLAASGIDINATNRDGNTALHVAALQNECCHVPDLLAVGINPMIQNKYGKLAEDLGRNNKRWMDLYQKYYPGLREAVRRHDTERTEYLLRCWSAAHIKVQGKDMRQYAASLTFHDLVALVDRYRFSLMAVHAIQEGDYKALEYALSRGMPVCNVNLLQQSIGSHPHHMLQHAVRRRDLRMVDMLCEAGADVNTPVYVKEYFRGPLFFEAFIFREDDVDLAIVKRILKNADLSAKDERGRTALIYAIDKRNGNVTLEIVQYLLQLGADISQRDVTGCTARNIAMFARRQDIVNCIDKHMLQMVKDSDVDGMLHLVEMGYDNIFVEYKYRDTWIYATGNETNEMTTFLEALPDFVDASIRVHLAIEDGNLEALKHEVHYFPSNLLLYVKDKGGRSPLLKAVLFGFPAIALWMMATAPGLAVADKDVLDRTPLHYAIAADEHKLIDIFKNPSTEKCHDCRGVLPCDMKTAYTDFLEKERKATYGLETEVHSVEIYEELLKIIRSKRRDFKDFTEKLKELRFPVAKFPNLFQPHGHPLVCHYRDLLLAAIDHNKLDIARKLISLGADSHKEKYDDQGEEEGVWMSARDRAQHLGHNDLLEHMDKQHYIRQSQRKR